VQSVEKSTAVSDQHIVSIFRTEELAEKEISMKAGILLLGLLFGPEDGGDVFLRNDGCLSTGYKTLYSRRYYYS
jgi:hypothetical protein